MQNRIVWQLSYLTGKIPVIINLRIIRSFILLLSLLGSGAFSSTQAQSLDSLKAQLRKDSARIYRPRNLQLLLSLDQRNTFIQTPQSYSTPFDLRGIKAGVVLQGRHKTGIGVYNIMDPKARIRRATNGPIEEVNLRFGYITGFYEYLFIHTRRWDIGIPIELGIGGYDAPRVDSTLPIARVRTFPAGTAIDIHFKPLRWFSLNGMGGYRFVLGNSGSVNLDNWYYAFGVSLITKNILCDTRYYLKKRKYKREVARIETADPVTSNALPLTPNP